MFGLTKPHEINWVTTSFLLATFAVAIIGTPIYIALCGLHPFLIAYFLFMFTACAMSITLGYHRCFSHRAFRAHWIIRLSNLTLLNGLKSHRVALPMHVPQ